MDDIKIWTILFFAIAVQGLFLALLLFSRRYKNTKGSHFFLGAFITLFSVILIFWVANWNNLIEPGDIFSCIYRPIPLLLGPFVFLYVKSFFYPVRFKDALHIIPFILVLTYFIPAYINPFHQVELSITMWNWRDLSYFFSYINTIAVVMYSCYLVYFIRHKTGLSKTSLRSITVKLLQLTILFFCAFSFFALINLWVRLNMVSHPIFIDIVLALLICVFIYGIGYIGFNMPYSVFSENDSNQNAYSSSKLNERDIQPLLNSILNYINEKRPYLKEGYQLRDLSEATQIASHHISELLNQYHHKSFSELINELRIEEAKKLLHSKQYQDKKIESIAYDVGFNSTSTFYTWFKKLTGTSPLIYQKRGSK